MTADTDMGLRPDDAYIAGDGTLRIPCSAPCGYLTHGYIGYTLAEAVDAGCPEAGR